VWSKVWTVFVVVRIGGGFWAWYWPIWKGCQPWRCRFLGCVRRGLVRRRIEWLHGPDGNIVEGWGLWSETRRLDDLQWVWSRFCTLTFWRLFRELGKGQRGWLRIRLGYWTFWKQNEGIFRWGCRWALLRRCWRRHPLDLRNHLHEVSTSPLWVFIVGRWRSPKDIGLWWGRGVRSGCWILIVPRPMTTCVRLDLVFVIFFGLGSRS